MLAQLLAGCAITPTERLDLDADLQIFETFDVDTDAREWRIQRRFAADGPTMPLGDPVFSVDVVAFQHGPKHPETPGATGFMLRLFARDSGWHFLRQREVKLRLDGSEFEPLGEGEYVDSGAFTELGSGHFNRETLIVPIWREDLQRIVRARVVQVQVGNRLFTLHGATRAAIGRLLGAVPDTVR